MNDLLSPRGAICMPGCVLCALRLVLLSKVVREGVTESFSNQKEKLFLLHYSRREKKLLLFQRALHFLCPAVYLCAAWEFLITLCGPRAFLFFFALGNA